MLVMQINRELLPFRFALGHHRFFKKMVLNVLWQVAPNPENSFPGCTEESALWFQQTIQSSRTSSHVLNNTPGARPCASRPLRDPGGDASYFIQW
jgi:hypothetical protein